MPTPTQFFEQVVLMAAEEGEDHELRLFLSGEEPIPV